LCQLQTVPTGKTKDKKDDKDKKPPNRPEFWLLVDSLDHESNRVAITCVRMDEHLFEFELQG
jgi:hypothetical protein